MKKFILLYCGHDESADAQARWGAWFTEHGARMVDGGGPLSGGRLVTPDGATDIDEVPVIGYSIISAQSQAEAEAIAASSPAIAGVRVYEAAGM